LVTIAVDAGIVILCVVHAGFLGSVNIEGRFEKPCPIIDLIKKIIAEINRYGCALHTSNYQLNPSLVSPAAEKSLSKELVRLVRNSNRDFNR